MEAVGISFVRCQWSQHGTGTTTFTTIIDTIVFSATTTTTTPLLLLLPWPPLPLPLSPPALPLLQRGPSNTVSICNSVLVLFWTHPLKFIDCTCLVEQHSSSIHRHHLHSRSIMPFHGEPRWGARARWGNCSFIVMLTALLVWSVWWYTVALSNDANWSSQLSHFHKRSGKE